MYASVHSSGVDFADCPAPMLQIYDAESGVKKRGQRRVRPKIAADHKMLRRQDRVSRLTEN